MSFVGSAREGATRVGPATGRRLDVPVVDIWRFQGGPSVDYPLSFNLLDVLGQLGAASAP
ncbi:hypothetical protein D7V97_08095 [Corallococcus sp. CA053C]|nr:hypothetical protein D7V97_08095 [Corallococcus sp. CA053C]